MGDDADKQLEEAVDDCPFCARVAHSRSTTLAVAFPDAFPVSTGHTLVVPRTHESDLFALEPTEFAAVWETVASTRAKLLGKHSPDGFTIGVNVGEAAGQTVAHAHVHVIPRYEGDVSDPRGGVRWVIPGQAPYWEEE